MLLAACACTAYPYASRGTYGAQCGETGERTYFVCSTSYVCLAASGNFHLRARGQARANVCQQTKCSAILDALQTLPHPQLRLGSQSPSSEASLAKVKGNTLGAGRCERRG